MAKLAFDPQAVEIEKLYNEGYRDRAIQAAISVLQSGDDLSDPFRELVVIFLNEFRGIPKKPSHRPRRSPRNVVEIGEEWDERISAGEPREDVKASLAKKYNAHERTIERRVKTYYDSK